MLVEGKYNMLPRGKLIWSIVKSIAKSNAKEKNNSNSNFFGLLDLVVYKI